MWRLWLRGMRRLKKKLSGYQDQQNVKLLSYDNSDDNKTFMTWSCRNDLNSFWSIKQRNNIIANVTAKPNFVKCYVMQ